MSTSTIVRDRQQRYVAELFEDDIRVRLYRYTSCLGEYVKGNNRTYTVSGTFIGEGNLLLTMVGEYM